MRAWDDIGSMRELPPRPCDVAAHHQPPGPSRPAPLLPGSMQVPCPASRGRRGSWGCGPACGRHGCDSPRRGRLGRLRQQGAMATAGPFCLGRGAQVQLQLQRQATRHPGRRCGRCHRQSQAGLAATGGAQGSKLPWAEPCRAGPASSSTAPASSLPAAVVIATTPCLTGICRLCAQHGGRAGGSGRAFAGLRATMHLETSGKGG